MPLRQTKAQNKFGGSIKELIQQIAKALVDNPEQVSVRLIEGEQTTVFELRVAQSDLGKVIGKQGRTASSIRTINQCSGNEAKKGSRLRFWSRASISHYEASFISNALSISRTGLIHANTTRYACDASSRSMLCVGSISASTSRR